ncbi:hypothetical protein MBLNU230_g8373t1 [Neophaeotheca triangularis]
MAPKSSTSSLEGKVAIVTGASRGIGAGLALDLAQRGANVTLTYTNPNSQAPTEALVQKITSTTASKAIAVQADLKLPTSPSKIIDATLLAFGPSIDILINNAAIISDAAIADISPAHFDEIFHTNVRAPLLMLQAVLPHLRRPGRIINISSVGARQGYPNVGMYAASKAALEGLTRNWAVELGRDGTTVNAVNPGPVQTEMLEKVDEATVRPQLLATPVQQRAGRVEEIAEVVGFLAGEGSSWVSGQCISASGGYAQY